MEGFDNSKERHDYHRETFCHASLLKMRFEENIPKDLRSISS